MKIKDIIDSKGSWMVTVGPHVTLHEALCTLIEKRVGALPVKNASGRLVGIITERDIMREVYNNSILREKSVVDVMTRDVVTGSPEDDIEYVMNAMTEGRFRHMPVMEGGKLAGIVSIGDIVKAQLHRTKHQVTQLMDYIAAPIVE